MSPHQCLVQAVLGPGRCVGGGEQLLCARRALPHLLTALSSRCRRLPTPYLCNTHVTLYKHEFWTCKTSLD